MLPSFTYKFFLLDTCILQDLSRPAIGIEVGKILSDLLKQNIKLSISDFATYELLRGATKKVEAQGEAVLNSFTRYHTITNVFRAAARLETFYKEEKVDSGISDGDKILAATSLITGIPLITRDGMDFPRPFFNEIHKELIQYNKRGRRNQITVMYFLEPNYTMILKKFDVRK